MNTYVIMYGGNNKNLLDDYEVIEGKTPKEALKKTYGKDYMRLTGEAGRYADIILMKGEVRNNTIYCEGKEQRLCFAEIA